MGFGNWSECMFVDRMWDMYLQFNINLIFEY